MAVKILAFIPNNAWIWTFGPLIRANLNAQRDRAQPGVDHSDHLDEQMAEIERIGDGKTGSARGRIPPMWTLSAVIRLRPPRIARSVFAGWKVVWATPILLPAAQIVLFACKESSSQLRITAAWELVIIATLTVLVAPMMRMSLGRFDVHSSSLRPWIRPLRRRGTEEMPVRTALSIYFIVIILISATAFASAYDLLSVTSGHLHPAFSTGGHWGAPWVEWLYFSVITVSTVGYGDIHPASTMGYWAVIAQVLTGPFLLTWVVAVVLESRES